MVKTNQPCSIYKSDLDNIKLVNDFITFCSPTNIHNNTYFNKNKKYTVLTTADNF